MRYAQRIAVIENGRISELGKPEELLAAGGYYARAMAARTRKINASAPDGKIETANPN